MTGNQAMRAYHERTKHYPGVANAPRRVDAGLVPKQYKRYLGLATIDLPAPSRSPRSFFDTLGTRSEDARRTTFEDLAAVLHYTAGIVRRATVGGRELAFRAASCTGALYHVEAYVVCSEIDGSLSAGIYHYDAPANALRPLRTGDHRGALAAACCDGQVASAAVSVVLTSTFWRNAWRYEERAYRHVFWDSGTMLANLLAVAESLSLRPVLRTAFVDRDVNTLLGVDGRREAAVAVVSLGTGSAAGGTPAVTPLNLEAEALSRAEIEYPLIWQTHEASAMTSCEEVRQWRSTGQGDSTDSTDAGKLQVRGLEEAMSEPAMVTPGTNTARSDVLNLQDAIARRVSARRFSDAALNRAALHEVLTAARGSPRGDHVLASSMVQAMLIVNRVEGVEPGAYRVDGDGRLPLVRAGDFAAEASHLALDQAAAGSAAANVYFVASMDVVAASLGERGYRAVQMEAGVRTGQVYLASASLGLRATGLTFYDDEVASFFGLDPEDALVLMAVVFGP